MAGDWIKWTKGFSKKPEVLAMAWSLGIDPDKVACGYMRIAEWLDSEGQPDNQEDRHSDITITLLSRANRDTPVTLLSHLDSVSGVPGLGAELKEVGWIELTDVAIVFKRAARHNTQTSKQRALASNRQAAKREKSVTKMSRANRDQRREEKRREEKNRKEERREDTTLGGTSSDSEPCPVDTPSEQPIMLFPVVGGDVQTWGLLPSKVSELSEAFPGVDVLAECRKARLWCQDHPTKQKTPRGMGRFLSGWMERSQNRGGGRQGGGDPRGNVSVLQQYCEGIDQEADE